MKLRQEWGTRHNSESLLYEWFSVAQENKGPDGGHWWFPTLAAMKLRHGWGTQFGD
jgi:hypothetical protein